jgi:hypothetical protein
MFKSARPVGVHPHDKRHPFPHKKHKRSSSEAIAHKNTRSSSEAVAHKKKRK